MKIEVILLYLSKRWLLQPLPWDSSERVGVCHRNSAFHITKLSHLMILNYPMIPARGEGTKSTSLGLLLWWWWCKTDAEEGVGIYYAAK